MLVEEVGSTREVLRLRLSGVFRTGEKTVDQIFDEIMEDMACKALKIRDAKLYFEAERCFRIGLSVNEKRLMELKKESEVADAIKM